jgi:outer membrane protein
MRRAFVPLFLLISFLGYSQNILTMEEAVQTGLENRFEIRLLKNQWQIAETNNTYGNAGFYPNVSFQAGQNFTVNNTKQEFFSGDVREGNNVNSNALFGAVVLDWTLFDGMNMFVQKDRLEKEVSRSAETFRQQIEAAVFDIQMAFLDVQETQDRIKVIEEAISISSERNELMMTRFGIGTVSGQELLQVQVDINADSLELEQAKIGWKMAKTRLNQAMNRAPETIFEIQPVDLKTGLYNFEEMIQSMMNSNRNLNIARMNEQLAELNIKTIQTQKWPTLNLGAAYNYNRSEAEIGIFRFNQNNGFTYGLSARWNLFDGFRVKNQIQSARIAAENTRLSREQLEMDLRTNVFQTLEQMYMLQNVVRLAENNKTAAEKNVEISLEKLNIGSLIPLELRIAQQNLINTSFQIIQQKYLLKRLEWNLLFAAGKVSS